MKKNINNNTSIAEMKDELTKGCAVLIVSVVLLFFFPAIIMWIWNGTIVNLFTSLPTIGYWDAMWIYILSNILFKSSRGGDFDFNR